LVTVSAASARLSPSSSVGERPVHTGEVRSSILRVGTAVVAQWQSAGLWPRRWRFNSARSPRGGASVWRAGPVCKTGALLSGFESHPPHFCRVASLGCIGYSHCVAKREPLGAWQRAQADFGAQQQVVAAKRMLKSPYLVPGDAEVLRLRIANPRLSVPELAVVLGMSVPALRGKLRGALNRGPGSIRWGSGSEEDRFVPAGEAARRVGVTMADLRAMARGGSLPYRKFNGGRAYEYRVGDLDRVRKMWLETLALVVDQLADMPS
jgi:hypothetical protein